MENITEQVSHLVATKAFTAIIVALVCLIAIKMIFRISDKAMKRSSIEPTLLKFIHSLIHIVCYFVVILIVAGTLGFNITSLVAVFSVCGAAFALAAQNSLSNLCSGVLLLFTRPFLIGDYISTGGTEGSVLKLGLLNTTLTTIDNKRICIPNSSISSSTITNFSTEGKRRVDLNFTASYDAPVATVKDALAEAVDRTPCVLNVAGGAAQDPFIRVLEYGDSSITYVVRVWCETDHYWDVYFDLIENVKDTFDENGVEMTYNHMIIHNA